MTESLNVLISGAGIAGATLAWWLLRGIPNARITIVERDRIVRQTGAGVDIRSSAVDIIKYMGLEETIRAHTTKEEGVEFVNTDGRSFATFKTTGSADVQSMTSEFEIMRGKLASILLQPISDRVEFIFDESIEKYEEADDGVVVTFANSKESKKFDLLVAADGVGSRIRGTMLNARPRDQIDDEGSHIAYFTMDKDLLQGGSLAKVYSTTGGRAVFIRPDPDPTGRCRCHLINTTEKVDIGTKRQFEEAMHQGADSYMQLLDESFKDAGWMTTEVLEGMRSSADFYCSTFAQVHTPKLVDRRVVLIGDAGYATRGLGTSLAIIGAYVLAGELMNNTLDPGAAAQKYEDIMLPFVKKAQKKLPGMMQMLNPQTSRGLAIRNTILGLVAGLRLDRLALMTGQYIGLTESKLDMPEYQWPSE